jgi:hypothetical protein
MAFASPGVQIKEVDLTATINVSDQNIGVVSIASAKGPTDEVTYVSSERELVDIFGEPSEYNYESWFAAATIIQYGGIAAVIRPAGGEPGQANDLALRTANVDSDGTTSTTLLINNQSDYEETYGGVTSAFTFAGRYGGTFHNGITVSMIDVGAHQQVTVTPAVGQTLTVDTVGAADASRTAGTYTIGASDYTAAGAGTGATFSIVVDGSGAATVTVVSGGSGYAVDDTITVADAQLGTGGGADLTFDIATVGASLAAAGSYIKWVSGSNTYEGTVYSNNGSDSYDVTLWDTTKRLAASSVIQDHTGATIATVSAITSNDLYSSKEYASGKKWVSIAPQPGTSPFVKSRGGKFDELHIVLVDTDGNVTGNPGTLIESFTYLSKASDAKSTEGDTKFWKKVLELSSSFIYGGDRTLAQTSDIIAVDDSSNVASATAIGGPSANAVYPVFNNVISKKLASGADYNWAGAASSIQSQVEASYDLVLDPEEFADIDFLVPGKITASGAAKLISVAESRRDCIAVVSPQRTDVINSNTSTKKTDSIIDFFNTLQSTSYAIFDSGYKYVYDKYNDTYRYLPCAADVAGLCINTTINSETWFSPAGYNRGNLRNATKLAYSPRQSERDRLYTARINPVVSFPGQGIVLFGDKTALSSPSAFDRINVRRLFIELEKNIARFSKFQLFEINDEITRSGFKGACDPYLRNVQGRRGIYDFLVVCDDSNNTPDVVDRNEFQAEIYIKPARTINFITITFVATRTGVSFNELIG